MTIEAFPLHWPVGEPRTQARVRGVFKVTFTNARSDLLHALTLLGAKDVVISSNIPLRRDGLPYADARVNDPGIAVYWVKDGVPSVMACDRYNTPLANLRAIGLTVEALRAIDRYGSRQMRDRAFRGFAALPANAGPIAMGSGPKRNNWWDVLGLNLHRFRPPNGITRADIEMAYRALTRTRHPDAGGSQEAMAELNAARDAALKEIK